MIATQNINKDTQISKIIIENLFLIIRNSSFRGKLYEQITDLITKQRKIFIRNPSYKTGGDTVYQFILLMLKMLEVINDCVEENIKSKLESKTLILFRNCTLPEDCRTNIEICVHFYKGSRLEWS